MMIRSCAEKAFWSSYWKIYGSLCKIKPYRESVRRCVEMMDVKQGGSYLDLACGPGITTSALYRSGINLIGTDYSMPALEIAKTNLPYSRYPGLAFSFGDINRGIRFEDGSFDGILAHNVMYLAEDPLFTMSEAHRVLKPGGTFVMSTPIEGASPLAILKEHLRLTARDNPLGAIKPIATFLMFLPFQIALKNRIGGASNFWPQEKWARVIDDLKKQGYSFNIAHAEPSYAGQNITFALKKV